jgi:hypothetical protein
MVTVFFMYEGYEEILSELVSLYESSGIKDLSVVGISLLTSPPEEGNSIHFRNVVDFEIIGQNRDRL